MTVTFLTEIKKMKRRYFPLLMICLFGFLWLWSTVNFRNIDDTLRASGYFSMLYSLPTLNTVVLPLFLSVLASRIWDTEHKGNTLKLLCTLEKRKDIFLSKSLIGALFTTLISCLECLLILIFGKIFAFTQTVPTTHLICFFITTFLTGTVLYLLQEILSLFFENQIVPLAIGLIGSFFGLFSLFFPAEFSQFVIWSYFCQLATIRINWDDVIRTVSYCESPLSLAHLLVILILLALACMIGTILFERKDI